MGQVKGRASFPVAKEKAHAGKALVEGFPPNKKKKTAIQTFCTCPDKNPVRIDLEEHTVDGINLKKKARARRANDNEKNRPWAPVQYQDINWTRPLSSTGKKEARIPNC